MPRIGFWQQQTWAAAPALHKGSGVSIKAGLHLPGAEA